MTAQEFNYDVKVYGEEGVALLAVAGSLDAHNFDRLEAAFHKLFEGGTYKIAVDLSRVDYISSAGVGAFFNALSTAREHGGDLVFLELSPTVRELFKTLSLEAIFTLADTREAAVKALGA